MTQAQTVQPPEQRAIEELRQEAGKGAALTISSLTGRVTFLATERGKPIPLSLAASAAVDERALAFLDTYGRAFGVDDPRHLAVRQLAGPDETGMEHARFQQLHRGVPVTGGEISVHLLGSTVVAINARILPNVDKIGVTPTLGQEEAKAAALEVLEKHLNVTDVTLSTPALQVFNRGFLEGVRSSTRLAWFVEAIGVALREFFWVDAERGAVLLHFSQLSDARTRKIHDAGSGSSLPGTLVRSEGGPATGDADADLAYRYSGDTYDYYWNEHGRDSFDGAGGILTSTVHFCPSPSSCPYANAFWNGTQMVYGDGFPAADDVVAHELTHAVTEYSAGLYYYMQSGALNESFSDIFGETVDLINGSGTDTPAVRWLMGEDVPGFGAVRNMMNPTAFGDPGKMSDSQLVCATPGNDSGGVHSNSGIPNHAYALMVDGGSYNGHTVTGIGLTKAGKIEYRALTYYLLTASDFLDADSALRQSCLDLIGTSGITVANCAQVNAALDAVELGAPWRCAPRRTVAELCPFGGTPTDLFADNFENVTSGNWSSNVLSGVDHWGGGSGDDGLYWPEFPASGVFSLWGFDYAAIGNSAAEMAVNVAIPAGARMQVGHSYGFENSFDGGVIEHSVNGGASWSNAGGLIVRGARYSGTVSSCCGNPLGGSQAFTADSFGYTVSQLDLSSLAGQNVRFRFRTGTDSSVADYGWFIDDVRIYTCSGAVTLYDQRSSPSSFVFTSQQFETGNSAFDSMAADDFVVAPGGWKIGGAEIPGVYLGGTLGPTPLLNVKFLTNAGGLPGSEVCSFNGLRSGIDFSDELGSLSVKLPAACCLPAGTFWIMAQADMDFTPYGQWYWQERTVLTGAPFAWKNPGNGFGTGCTNWSTGTSCNAPDPDLTFALWQVPAPPANLYLTGKTIDSTRLYEASNSITADNFRLVGPANATLRSGSLVTLGAGFKVEAGSRLSIAITAPTGCP